jgi:hypothetical protein
MIGLGLNLLCNIHGEWELYLHWHNTVLAVLKKLYSDGVP